MFLGDRHFSITMSIPTIRFEKHLQIDRSDKTAVDHLVDMSGLSKQKVKQAMQKGASWLTQSDSTRRIRRASKVINVGDTLHLYYDEDVLSENPQTPRLIADQGAYSIWYKPYGMRCQGSKWGDHCTINRWVEQHHTPQRPAFIVHRLDRAATGLMIIAHTKKMAKEFSRIFREREIKKRYRATVHGCFPDIGESTTLDAPVDNKPAISHVSFISYDINKDYSFVQIDIETGRKHQIRRHLSDAGYPIVGDRLYGSGEDTEDLQLMSFEMEFECPIEDKIRHYILNSSEAMVDC